ncbi:MAG TPA: SDR family NAD(P)-dependent oxidoreductase, partial [Beijerinckiaceae bacterium]
MGSLRDRHALVTGGGRGIGLAVAQALTVAGAAVTVLGRDRDSLERAVRAGAAKGVVVADVTDADSLSEAVAEARKARGAIDL